MKNNQTNDISFWQYNFTAKLFHWVFAFLIIGLIIIGWYMVLTDSEWYFKLHKSFGILAGALIGLRILWAYIYPREPLPLDVPHWQATTARLTHWLLYICMILMPLSGFIGSQFSGYGIEFFNISLPIWFAKNTAIAEALFEVHLIVSWILIGAIVFHILAAMKHLFINKDHVFQRMWLKKS